MYVCINACIVYVIVCSVFVSRYANIKGERIARERLLAFWVIFFVVFRLLFEQI